jgi:hypothetical protein
MFEESIMRSSPECHRCRGTMEPGYLLDRSHRSTLAEPRWVEGTPEHSFWTGLKTKGREVLAVTTFRCTKCGYLESYATERAKV